MKREERTAHILNATYLYALKFDWQPFDASYIAAFSRFRESEVESVLVTYSGNRGEWREQYPNYFRRHDNGQWMFYDIPRLKDFAEAWKKRLEK